jgi:hypothetical protein
VLLLFQVRHLKLLLVYRLEFFDFELEFWIVHKFWMLQFLQILQRLIFFLQYLFCFWIWELFQGLWSCQYPESQNNFKKIFVVIFQLPFFSFWPFLFDFDLQHHHHLMNIEDYHLLTLLHLIGHLQLQHCYHLHLLL